MLGALLNGSHGLNSSTWLRKSASISECLRPEKQAISRRQPEPAFALASASRPPLSDNHLGRNFDGCQDLRRTEIRVPFLQACEQTLKPMKQLSLVERQALSFVSQRIGWIEGRSSSRGPESKTYIQHRCGWKRDQDGAPIEDKR